MGNPDNRREHPRVTLKQTVAVANDTNLALAEVDDITLGGIALRAEGSFAVGSRFHVVFPGAGDIKENEVEAEVVQCKETQTDSNFKHQIRAKFIDANQKYVEDAIALIKG